MPRPERPLDPTGGPVAEFAVQLRELRRTAGSPGYRQLARRAHFSAATLAAAAAGRRLPSLEVTLAFVDACGGDREEWRPRWQAAAAQVDTTVVATGPDGDEAPAPYLGLAAYQPGDAHLFFGRDRLVADLLDRLAGKRFLAVFGPSGCGKSSLLRAGLVPAMQARQPGPALVLTPGPHPMTELVTRLEGLTDPAPDTGLPALAERMLGAAPQSRLLLVVDQFEEIFTLCRDEPERCGFVAALLALADSDGQRIQVVLGVRADFYAACATLPDLVAGLRDAQVLVGPMTATELREAIVRPAERSGLIVEGALVSTVVAEMAGTAGGLPMVSHVLLEVWRRRRGNALTLAGYEAAGGVQGALAQTAEALYARLDGARRETLRGILTRLVALGSDVADSRRRAERAELDLPHVDEVLDQLAAARLVTLDRDTVELAHEALLRGWPRLRQWLSRDREGLRVHRQVTDAAQVWQSLDRDPGSLYRGARLAAAREWLATRQDDAMTQAERAFLDASIEQEDREAAAAARRSRLLRYLAVGLAAALVVVTVIGTVAIAQRRDAVRAERTAISRQIATQALTIADSAPQTAMLLAVQAYDLAQTDEARGALLSMSAHRAYAGELAGHQGPVSEVDITPDGRRLISVGKDRTLRVWDIAAHRQLAAVGGHDTWLRAAALSSDGRLVATGGDDHAVKLWDLDRTAPVATLTGHTGPIKEIAFSPDARLLATASADATVGLWDVATHTRLATLTGHDGGVNSVTFSPDGRTLATAGADDTIMLWDVATRARQATLPGNPDSVRALAFSPDGRLLASGGGSTTAIVWDLASRTPLATFTHGTEDEIITLKFSADGRTLATAGDGSRIMLWDLEHRTLRSRLIGHSNSVYTLDFSPDGHTLATAGEGGTIALWDLTHTTLGSDTDIANLAYRPDGKALAAASGPNVTLWDPAERTMGPTYTDPGPVLSAAFSPDGRILATAPELDDGQPGRLVLRDPATGAATTLTGHTGYIMDIAFSPDGHTIATGSVDGTAILWDADRRVALATLSGHDKPVNGVRFSPDGRTLVTVGHDQAVILWDVASHNRIATLTGHTGWIRTAAFSPDGRLLATADSDQTVIVWDVRTRSPLATLTDYADGEHIGLAFSPDGRTLAYSSVENTIVLWNVATRAATARLTGHPGPIRALTFDPGGKTLASSSEDGTAILWDTDPQRIAGQLCATLARDLTPDEWNHYIPDLPYQRTCPAP